MGTNDQFAKLISQGVIRRVSAKGQVTVAHAIKTESGKYRSTEERGREAWRILHSEPHGNADWLADWAAKHIPKGCGCTESATTLLDLCPPRYDSPEEWFAWTVEFHNLVNEKLRKPELSLDEAIAIWRKPVN